MTLLKNSNGTAGQSYSGMAGRLDAYQYVDLARLGLRPGDGQTINDEINNYLDLHPVSAQNGGITFAASGSDGDDPYLLANEKLVLDAWVNIVGAGMRSVTRFLCTGSSSGIIKRSRGGVNGNFTIDANEVATQPFYTDAVDATFSNIEVRDSAGTGFYVENAQNNIFDAIEVDKTVGAGILLCNGASANMFRLPRVTNCSRAWVEVVQEVAQGAAYPNGLSGTILAQLPNYNKFSGGMFERIGTTIGGGTVGVADGGVIHSGGDTQFDSCNFSIVPTTTETSLFDMDNDGVATVNRVAISGIKALGDTTYGVFCHMRDTSAVTSLSIRGACFIQAFKTAWKLGDVSGTRVTADLSNGSYISVTNRFENVGAGTKTYDQMVRGSRLEAVDSLRPAGTDHIWTTKRTADGGYRAGMTADGVLYQGDASTSTLTQYPGFFVGTGSPEGSVSGRIGSLYRRLDGGANTTLYVKESGTGTTGWVAK